MSTAHIYNGFGKYETNERGERGITLKFAGVNFWAPFEGVCYLPDYTFREVDHDKSTAENEEEGVLTYKTFVIKGERIAEELLEVQVPYKTSDKGIIKIYPHERKYTGNHVNVPSGYTEDGIQLFTEVREITPSEEEKATAAKLAKDYKEGMIQEYFQSKRERMSGGKGQIKPMGSVKVFMDELGVKDLDDVSKYQESGANGISLEMALALIDKMQKANELNGNKLLEAVETVKRSGKISKVSPSKVTTNGGSEEAEAS